jgi:hypothetical protein
MDKPRISDPIPTDFQQSWHERLLSMPFWEYLIENRGPVIAIAIAAASLFVGIGIYLSKHQTSSIAQMFKAQHLAKVLKSTDNPSADKKEALGKLEEIVVINPTAAAAFSGTVAQEELIQNIEPPTIACFETALNLLQSNNLSIQSDIDKISLLYAKGEKEGVLVEIDALLQHIEKLGTPCPVPNAYAYVLLQKATILKELHRSTNATIEEFERTLVLFPELNTTFERICTSNVTELVSFLRDS